MKKIDFFVYTLKNYVFLKILKIKVFLKINFEMKMEKKFFAPGRDWTHNYFWSI